MKSEKMMNCYELFVGEITYNGYTFSLLTGYKTFAKTAGPSL